MFANHCIGLYPSHFKVAFAETCTFKFRFMSLFDFGKQVLWGSQQQSNVRMSQTEMIDSALHPYDL